MNFEKMHLIAVLAPIAIASTILAVQCFASGDTDAAVRLTIVVVVLAGLIVWAMTRPREK